MAHRPILPSCYGNVGAMLREKIAIAALCEKCRASFAVDLAAIVAEKGETFSLIGRHPRCRIADCGGRCMFLVGFTATAQRVTLDRWAKD